MLKTISEKIILKNKFHTICNNVIETESGKLGEHIIFGQHGNNETDGVSVLALNDKGQVYIFREFRYGINGYIWTIATGGCEKGLTIEENAAKELAEETGLKSEELQSIAIKTKNDPAIKNVNVNYYIAKNCIPIEGEIKSDDTESFMDGQWVEIDDLVEKILSGELEFSLYSLPVIFYYYQKTKGL